MAKTAALMNIAAAWPITGAIIVAAKDAAEMEDHLPERGFRRESSRREDSLIVTVSISSISGIGVLQNEKSNKY
jgi:hypothetical protein